MCVCKGCCGVSKVGLGDIIFLSFSWGGWKNVSGQTVCGGHKIVLTQMKMYPTPTPDNK